MTVHPALVHFPVALMAASWVGETRRLWPMDHAASGQWEFFARILLWWTLPALALAVVSGNLEGDRLALNHDPAVVEAGDALARHEVLGYSGAALAMLLAWWRSVRGTGMNPSEHRWYWAALTAVLAVVLAGAWQGGRLVYGHGLGIEASVENRPSIPLNQRES